MPLTLDHAMTVDRNLAWGLYLGCGVVVFLIFVWLTHRWQRDIRLLLLALLAMVMFLPAPIPGHGLMAPAIIFVAFGVLTGGLEALAPVLVRFSLVGVGIVLLVVVESIWWRYRRRHRKTPAKPAAPARNATRSPARNAARNPVRKEPRL